MILLRDESQKATTDLINSTMTAAYTPTETMTSNMADGFSWRQSYIPLVPNHCPWEKKTAPGN
jgi:hypothetical protein